MSATSGNSVTTLTVSIGLVHGDVVTAELGALLAYGHRRIAQRRLARLVEYGLLTGFWAANRQRPRGRYAYALTRATRAALERMIWPDGQKKLYNGAPESVSPVIHGLATHDVFAAFLRASDATRGVGLSAWVSERPLIRLTWTASSAPAGARSLLPSLPSTTSWHRTERAPTATRSSGSEYRVPSLKMFSDLDCGLDPDSPRRLRFAVGALSRVSESTYVVNG